MAQHIQFRPNILAVGPQSWVKMDQFEPLWFLFNLQRLLDYLSEEAASVPLIGFKGQVQILLKTYLT